MSRPTCKDDILGLTHLWTRRVNSQAQVHGGLVARMLLVSSLDVLIQMYQVIKTMQTTYKHKTVVLT